MNKKNSFDSDEVSAFSPFESDKVVEVRGDYALSQILSHYCGYCKIEADKIPSHWHGSYRNDNINYLNVSGGITFASISEDKKYVFFGFDCGHAGDNEKPELQNREHLFKLCQQMKEQILLFADKRQEYLALQDETERARFIEDIRAEALYDTA